ncbi:serine acetyltransferase [Aliivibrio fischeri MJ11]|uniref:Serine acetyltransferase n=1 Tax=Aliivibrio fischeri (strain MJ11) TaxID=388396 RepID=B5FFW6_ALIFM|nr:serine acetyltransferase [Aliivibrio fischeri]ACH64871.1 serine acetyltransferase [Aliivibrio fischeri MJ11]
MVKQSLVSKIVEDMIFTAYKLNSKKRKLNINTVILMLITPEFRLILSYRINNCLYNLGWRRLAYVLYLFSKVKYSSDIHPKANIGVPFKVGHHMGIVIGPEVIIGRSCYIMNNVTIGNKYLGGKDSMPTLNDNIIVGVGSRILGGINIGSNATIGANSVVIDNVASNEVWVGIPAKKAISIK